MAGADPVTARRLRNYRAMHLLNQGLAADALAELGRPVPPVAGSASVRSLVIDRPTAGRLSAESPGASRLRGQEGLTQEDKAQILDGQALQLRGTVLRLLGRDAEAAEPFNRALTELVAIRGGRIAATLWLRAQIHGELAGLAEAVADQAEAERQHRIGIALLETNYPGSSALLGAQGRLAGYYARNGRIAPALVLFRAIVNANAESGDSSPALRRILEPYFALLVRPDAPQGAVADLFAASQVLVRPGVAQTQAVLARELSGGSDEAARLFRQSVNLTRDIERGRIELARLEASDTPTAAGAARIIELRASLGQWQQDQVATQARLAAFPRYRAVSSGLLALADLQHLLRPGEAYYKMIVVGGDAYAVFLTADAARAFRIGAAPAEIERQVDRLRATISLVRDNQQLTYPFDLELAHGLYQALFGPVAGEIGGGDPPRLRARRRDASAAAQSAGHGSCRDRRLSRAAPPVPMTTASISAASNGSAATATSAPPSPPAPSATSARRRRAAPAPNISASARTRRRAAIICPAAVPAAAWRAPGCTWSLAAWNRPISAKELVSAGNAVSGGRPGQAEIVTGAAFTDTAITARDRPRQLSHPPFRHPRPGDAAPRPECPARPALLTSFGGEGSDGLLTFGEIFDLRLDADLVILSACDTAGRASATATEEAGLSSGGEFALDGLVRAFVGAGGRMVIASHWPVPDDYNATERLISGLFAAPPGTGTAGALRLAQRALMDEADTSHPYYWSGFAVVGDGAAPVIRPAAPRGAAAH